MLSVYFSELTIILLIASVFPVLFLLLFYRRRVTCVTKHIRMTASEKEPVALPSVSIIVYSNNDSDNLAHMLPEILNQEYPATFEVIVVNDGASEATKDIVNELSQIYHNLYITYTPNDARYLSRKKLSLTIGIKAAKYDYVLITKSSCRISSRKWLTSMTKHFADGKDIVIGHASYAPEDDSLWGNRSRAFNATADAVAYLSSAISGKPYRGIDANIAYSKDIFFRNKGFSHSLNLHYGDDDIFISEIATGENTAVELSADSHVKCIYRRSPREVYRDNKIHYNFTAKFINKRPAKFFGFASLMTWSWLTLSTAAIISATPNLIPVAVVTLSSLILWLPLMFAWRKTSLALHSRKIFLTLPMQMLYRPIHNAIYRLKGIAGRKWNYTWQKL